MNLAQLVYVSRPAPQLTFHEVEEMVEAAAARNRDQDITGLLLHRPGQFFTQLLEGERSAVFRLFERIAEDDRHECVRLVALRDVDSSSFPTWGMNLFFLTDERLSHLEEVGVERDFDPWSASLEQLAELLVQLSRSPGLVRDASTLLRRLDRDRRAS